MSRKVGKIGLSIITIFWLLFQPMVIAATDSAKGTTTALKDSASQAEILTEVESLREESVKIFRKSDGGYIAAIYGEAIHYQEESGAWKEIDNTFLSTALTTTELTRKGVQTENKAIATVPYYQNTSNAFRVSLPSSIDSSSPVVVEHKNYALGFALQGVATQPAVVSAALGNSAKISATETAIQSKDGVLTYANVFTDTKLVYEMRGKKLKESLVFSKPPTKTSFTFDFHYEDLYPQVLASGEVRFYNNKTFAGNPIFVVAAPYMFDSGEGYTNDVEVAVQEYEKGCRYTLTPDLEWLNDPSRVYPVTLDPTVSTSLAQTEIHDNTVHESDPNVNYINADRLYVGSVVLSSGTFESRTYIKFPRVSSIPTTAYIASATMILNHHSNASYQSGNNNMIAIYDCGTNAWGTSNITWNTQSNFSFGEALLVCGGITDSSLSSEQFDITTLVHRWYSTTDSNNGLAIIPKTVYTNASNRTAFYSSDISSSISTKRPHVEIEYYLPSNAGVSPTNMTSYFIKNVSTGKYLTVLNGVEEDLQNVLTTNFTGAEAQKWRVEASGTSGTFFLRSCIGTFSKYLDVYDGNVDIYMYDPPAQKFAFVQQGTNGTFYIKLESEFVSEDTSGNVIAGASNLGDRSLWIFEPIYSIVSPLSPFFVSDCYLPSGYQLSGRTWFSGGEALRILRSSSVAFFRCHGNSQCISPDGIDEGMTKAMVDQLPANDLEGAKLVVYVACKCAEGGSQGDNLVKATYQKGAAVVVGFQRTIGEVCGPWMTGVMKALRQGQTVESAMENGDFEVQAIWPGIEDLVYRTACGNTNTTILL